MASNRGPSSNSHDHQQNTDGYNQEGSYGLFHAQNYETFCGQVYDDQSIASWNTPPPPNNPSTYGAPTGPDMRPATNQAFSSDLLRASIWSELTYVKLAEILNTAHICTGPQYRKIPILVNALTANIEHAYEDCVAMQRPPRNILDGYIESERMVVKAWNEHRLGHATLQKLLNTDPRTASEMYNDYYNVEDLVSSFPIRCSAVFLGVAFKQPFSMPRFEHPLDVVNRIWAAQAQTAPPSDTFTYMAKDPITALPHVQYAQIRPFQPQPTRSFVPAMPRENESFPTVSGMQVAQVQTASFSQAHAPPASTPVIPPTAPDRRRSKSRRSGSPRTPGKYNKLEGAPSQNLPFPREPCNITITELICFLPQWLKSIDVIDRAVSNGGSAGTVAKMINLLRNTGDEGIGSCSVLRMMQASMRKRDGPQYAHWAVGNHTPPPGHNSSNISIAGFRTPRQTHKDRTKAPLNTPFKDLAKNVKVFPQITDVLDLTRCVQYHMHPAHQHEEWNFPDDFQKLVNHLGGPAKVTPLHLDGAIFERWMPPHTRRATELMFSRERDAKGRLLKRTYDEAEDETETQLSEYEESQANGSNGVPQKRARGLPHRTQSPDTVRRTQPLAIDSDSEDDAYKGSLRANAQARKNIKQNVIRRSGRFLEKPEVDYDHDPINLGDLMESDAMSEANADHEDNDDDE